MQYTAHRRPSGSPRGAVDCPSETTRSSPGATISGVVIDESRRMPIAKERLVSSAGTVTADAQGRFTIGPLPSRISWLQISADGYFPRLE